MHSMPHLGWGLPLLRRTPRRLQHRIDRPRPWASVSSSASPQQVLLPLLLVSDMPLAQARHPVSGQESRAAWRYGLLMTVPRP